MNNYYKGYFHESNKDSFSHELLEVDKTSIVKHDAKPIVEGKNQLIPDSMKGIIYFLFSVICSATYSFMAKVAYKKMTMPPQYDVFMRGFFIFTFVYFMARRKSLPMIEGYTYEQKKLLLTRAILGGISMMFYNMALNCASLSKVIISWYINPIVTAMMGYALLGEKVTKLEIVGSFTAFFGLILVAKPPFLFGTVNDKESDLELLGIFFSSISAVLMAVCFIVLRKMSGDIHYIIVTLYWSAGVMVANGLSIILFGITPKEPLTVNLSFKLGYLITISIPCLLYTCFVNLAFNYEKAGRLAPLGYLLIVFSLLLDSIFLGTHIYATDIIGAILIVGFSFAVTMLKCAGKIK